MQFVSARLIGARKAKGLSQDELAGRIGVSLRSVQNWEGNINEPQGKHLRNLSEVLGVDISYLYGDSDAAAVMHDEMPAGSQADVRAQCHEYLDKYLNLQMNNPHLISWTFIQLRRHFPLKPNSALDAAGEDLLSEEAASADHADQSSPHSRGAAAPNAPTSEPGRVSYKSSKAKPAVPNKAPK